VTTILAEVTRSGEVESAHAGAIAVMNTRGNLIAAAGDPDRFAYFRSSAKPFQAIPVVESGAADRFGFTPAELALCCASHSAEPRHQEAVAAMLAKIGLDTDALRCGASLPIDEAELGRVLSGISPRSALHCDCSGKHTGMLATCRQLGYPTESYLEPNHPLQSAIRRILGEVCRVDPDSFHLAADGCSVPTFGAPLRAFATAYAALGCPDDLPAGAGLDHAAALNRLRDAMVTFPENVAGEGRLDTDVMELAAGAIAGKTGAEGLFCMAIPNAGLGIAIRIADGSYRALPVVAVAVLEQLGIGGSALHAAILARQSPLLFNHNGWEIGEIRAAFRLR
jgi:L-asparaginase II